MPTHNGRMAKSSVALPGLHTPGVGFEQPFEMLEACHERVQRSLDLLQRLQAHIEAHGHDAASRSAAADVLRYFDQAGPHHHEDEERHIFPLLADHPRDEVRAAVVQLQADHVQMHALWARLRTVLQHWQADAEPPPVDEHARALVTAFVQSYAQHIPLEEDVVYPAARPLVDSVRLAEMGNEMGLRRRTGGRKQLRIK